MANNRNNELNKKECKDRLFIAQAKANEWCRITNHTAWFGVSGSGESKYLWDESQCRVASKEVIQLIKECETASLKK